MWRKAVLILLCNFCHRNFAEIIQAQPGDVCELKLNSSNVFLSINRTWSNSEEPCTLYKCIGKSGGETHIEVVRLNLNCNSSCATDFVYKALPHECCGQCVPKYCASNNRNFLPGDIWKSFDNCTVNECIDTGRDLVVSSYRKSCPKLKNCPQENIEMKDCCPYCNFRSQKYLQQFNEVEFTTRDTYRSHPCLRECVEGEQLTCYYEFVVEEFQTMSKACYNCPSNQTDCFRPHCVSADGMKRSITTVNRMMPGPSIEVCLHDTIIVDVKNHLMSEGTTIHWHGMHQRNSPYMDGVPHVSQCPIPAGQTFRYNFNAENAGTHFWHSHLGMQRGDGVFGALIVRKAQELHENLYDYDMSEHTLMTNDWTHMPGNSVFTAHHHGGGDNKPPNILINGRGKYFGNLTVTSEPELQSSKFKIEVNDEEISTDEAVQTTTVKTTMLALTGDNQEVTENPNATPSAEIVTHERSKRGLIAPNDDSPFVPYETFNVVKGHRYRFRHINAGFLNCPIELSVDNHTLTAIASDGNSLEPQETTFLVTYAGERWDFIINANQAVGNYFIRARGLMDCDDRFTSSFQMAVLHYNGAPDEAPVGKPCYNLTRKGLVVNSLNRGHGLEGSRTVAELTSAENPPNHNVLKAEPDLKFFLSYDFYGKDNPLFHDGSLYGFNQASFGKIYTPQINHITMKMPSTPAMLAKGLYESSFCNESSLAAQGVNCKETFCECPHVLQIPLNSTVEIILIDEGVTYDANHMFHLHGHFFHVVGMDRLGRNVTLQEIKELDRVGRLKRKIIDSPQKDTVTVPDGGYTIIRFYADNPGVWLLHCHIDFHAEVGMAVMLKIGEYHQMAPVPRNFPTCYDYIAHNEEDEKLQSSATTLANSLTCLLTILFISLLTKWLT